jgi:acyl CoA:acetate/3-ketoacid CoA transferase alpha subunit/acyl CoA:acetate/3-ketoacid CoA transferase beta subunit
MDPVVSELLEKRFRIPPSNEDKTVSLRDAVERFVRPGDALHLGLTHTRGGVAAWEILRRFHGQDPRFTLLGVQVTTPASPLVHAGLVRKVVTSWAGDSYYAPGPSPVYQRAWQDGVEFEHWSILTYVQRLAAAARGLSWTTTRSLTGSSMARDNRHDYREWEPGLGMVSALVPDVSVLHAVAADRSGNVVLTPPLMENVYGALAAKRGAVVTVEKIVDASVIREHSHLVRLPSSAVAAVVEAPLGGHPGGLSTAGLTGELADIEPYGDDYEFWAELREAGRDPAALDTWMKEWVLDVASHEAYRALLGSTRIERLRRRARVEGWREDLDEALEGVDLSAPPTPEERAVVAAARVLRSRIRERGYRTLLAGAGMSNLAAWLAAYTLTEDGVPIDLAAEMGLVGYWPHPGEPMLFNQRNFPTCTMLADIDWTMSILVGGGTAKAIGALGAAQVDRRGNLNSTMIPGQRLLMGSGGANDVATCAAETVVSAVQTRDRFLEDVSYVTAPGDRIGVVVTQCGVYEKVEDGELVLTGVYEEDIDAGVREARDQCGWELRVARRVRRVEPPAQDDLLTLRLMDPHGWFRS